MRWNTTMECWLIIYYYYIYYYYYYYYYSIPLWIAIWEDNIKVDLEEISWDVEWINLTEGKDH
jgi:hypothetical protein